MNTPWMNEYTMKGWIYHERMNTTGKNEYNGKEWIQRERMNTSWKLVYEDVQEVTKKTNQEVCTEVVSIIQSKELINRLTV